MLNESISELLSTSAIYKTQPPKALKALRSESENICESIEYGLMHLGEMMSVLGNLADEKEQNFTHKAMSNADVKHIGGLIKANAYLLYCLRNTTLQANDYLKGAK